jgi:hypothetical protein
MEWFNHPQYYASSSTVLALPPFELDRLWRRQHPASLACDTEQQYIAPVDGNHSNVQAHFLPTLTGIR